MALALAACGAETEWSAYQLAYSAAEDSAGELTYVGPDSELYGEYVAAVYGLDPDTVTDGAIFVPDGASAREVAVFRFTSEGAAADAESALEAYLLARGRAFYGYMPEEADMVENAELVTRGEWCAMMVLPDSQSAAETFERCFGSAPPDGIPPAPDTTENTPSVTDAGEDTEWSYDAGRIITAYRTGSHAGLDSREREILDAAGYILTEVAPDTLSAPERELAIHDYLIDNIRYDSDTLSVLPTYTTDPDNDNPYGALVNGLAVCLGYASSFQLLMDLAGIECITVHGGTADEEHAWNMVRLDGDWYCVDVTWDDPSVSLALPESFTHQYFNVTSNFMRETGHIWDETRVPEAEGTRWAWENIPH